MYINSNFNVRVAVLPEQQQFIPSPLPGIERIMLDRAGAEVARATSVVRYAAGSGYTSHHHQGGEEILVLEGIFSDEHGHYPAGTYLRNPPGSSHQPYSEQGCLLLVKLWQFHAEDNQFLVTNTRQQPWYPGLVPGLTVQPLHEHHGISTALVRWAANTHFNRHTHPGGEEIFVLEGTFYDEHGEYPAGSWLRNPRYSTHTPFTKHDGALIYVKTGHLGANLLGDRFIDAP